MLIVATQTYAKGKQQANDCTLKDSSESKDDGQDEGRNPTGRDGGFELDDGTDLPLPSLHQLPSNERPEQNSEGATAPTISAYAEMENRKRLISGEIRYCYVGTFPRPTPPLESVDIRNVRISVNIRLLEPCWGQATS